jgi:Alpha-galactosidases/6-phospho-beta-glucosidases, family 4 of glycosyl hydrolases
VPGGPGGSPAHPRGSLPPQLAALNRLYLNVCELTVRARSRSAGTWCTRRRSSTPAAATLSIDEIIRVCDELIDAHGELIPAGIRGG